MAGTITALITAVGGTIPSEVGDVDVRGLNLEDVEFVAGAEPLMFGGWAFVEGMLVRYYGPDGTDVTVARAAGDISLSAAPAQRFAAPARGGGFAWGAEARDGTEVAGRTATAAEAVEAALAASI